MFHLKTSYMKFIVFHVEQKILTEGDSELFIVNIDHSWKENPKKRHVVTYKQQWTSCGLGETENTHWRWWWTFHHQCWSHLSAQSLCEPKQSFDFTFWIKKIILTLTKSHNPRTPIWCCCLLLPAPVLACLRVEEVPSCRSTDRDIVSQHNVFFLSCTKLFSNILYSYSLSHPESQNVLYCPRIVSALQIKTDGVTRFRIQSFTPGISGCILLFWSKHNTGWN